MSEGLPQPQRYGEGTRNDGKDALRKAIQELAAAEKEASDQAFHDQVHAEHLTQMTGDQEKEINELKQEATIDHLTGVDNRKTFENKLSRTIDHIHKSKRIPEEHRARGESIQTVALIAVDVDHFKDINDTFGHPVGDLVLVSLGKILRESVRDTDSVARIGGEEFMVLMPGATARNALRHAESLRQKIAALVFEDYPDLKITASFGAADSTMSEDGETLREYADKALYGAKNDGRNQVMVYTP
jgi:diguanylate cyclase